jgi:hypothetical protein
MRAIMMVVSEDINALFAFSRRPDAMH